MVVSCSAVQSSGEACFTSCFKDLWTAAYFPSYGHSTEVPIPNKNSVRALHYLRPLAPTSLVMKTMERVMKKHIIMVTNPLIEPLQFVHCASNGIGDVKVYITATVHKHLEQLNTTVRLLFADFSSEFNTLRILVEKLSTCFHLEDQLLLCIIDFLTNRSQ